MNAPAKSNFPDLLRHTLDFFGDCLSHHDFPGALEALNRARNLAPRDVQILSQRGQLHLLLQNQHSAQADFEAALKLDPGFTAARAGLAECSRPPVEPAGTRWAERTAVGPLLPPAAPRPGPSESALGALQEFHKAAHELLADVEAPPLSERHLSQSRILPDRDQILPLMPRGGVCAELGTQTGAFAKQILAVLQPSRFHIFDIDFTPFDQPHFQSPIQQGIVQLHPGDSSTLLGGLPDRSFDFIYIDGDHSYAGVVRDLEQAGRKIKDDGWIVCNDYTLYSPLEKSKYGVYRAVNEFCLHHNFEIRYLALHRWGYHDVALKKLPLAAGSGNSATPQPEQRTSRIDKSAPAASTAGASTPFPTASTPDAEVRRLARYVGDDWKQQPYYDDAEQYMEKQWLETIWPFIHEASFDCVLDLAAGHGRNSEKLKHLARKIYLVDINQENIEFCRKRFAGDDRFVFIRNDGCSLEGIDSNTVSLVYCFDAMVHFDSDVVRAYLREFYRILRPNGLGFCHHSNHTRNPGGNVHENPGWRNFMSEALFAHWCAKEHLPVVKSRVIDWTGPGSDCVTLFRK